MVGVEVLVLLALLLLLEVVSSVQRSMPRSAELTSADRPQAMNEVSLNDSGNVVWFTPNAWQAFGVSWEVVVQDTEEDGDAHADGDRRVRPAVEVTGGRYARRGKPRAPARRRE